MMGCYHMDCVLGSWAMFAWGLVFLGFNILWVGLRFSLIKINGFWAMTLLIWVKFFRLYSLGLMDLD
jgi:hypothetical protein